MRKLLRAAAVGTLAIASGICAHAQLGRIEGCLPIPSYGSELEEYRAELRGDFKQPIPDLNRIAKVTFAGQVKMPLQHRQRLVAKLKSLRFDDGKEWQEEVRERIRQAWQEHGYFKSTVSMDTLKLPRRNGYGSFEVIATIDEGKRYTLKEVRFKTESGKAALIPATRMRAMFPIKDGAVFSTSAVRSGLDNLIRAYSDRGYIKFTAIPDTDDTAKAITLIVDLDEGPQYSIAGIQVMGVTPRQAKSLQPIADGFVGKVYAKPALNDFWKKAQPILPSRLSINEISQDDVRHTVVLHLDLRDCASLTKKTTTVVAER